MLKIIILLFVFISQPAFAEAPQPEAASGHIPSSPVFTENAIAVTANPHATQAAYDILQQGGTALDAAIAAQMVLNVVEPQSSGIGGGGFLLYYDAKQQTLFAYDGREAAPASAHPKMFLDAEGNPIPFLEAVKGGRSVGVPALLHMLDNAYKTHGKTPWKDLFSPAINIARNGFELSERLHTVANNANHVAEFPTVGTLLFTKDHNAKPVGTLIKNPELADTFEAIANNGIEDFYHGKLAEKIADAVQQSPIHAGYLAKEDLAAYKSKLREPVCNFYREYKVCGMPPPSSGGITVLQTLGILEKFTLAPLKPNSKTAIHLITEATKIAFADRNYYIADNDFVPVPINQMLDKDYLEKRAESISALTATPPENIKPGMFSLSTFASYSQQEPLSTTHLSIKDSYGNIVSMTTTIEHAFGSGLMVEGFLLNNEMTDFSFVPEKDGKPIANAISPFKRPRSSMSPMIVFDKDDKPIMAIGSPGGARIIPYVIQTLVAVLDWKLPIHEAVNLPHHTTLGTTLDLEEGTAITALAPELEKMGHKVAIKPLNSGLHGLMIMDSKIAAGVDFRREGTALGN